MRTLKMACHCEPIYWFLWAGFGEAISSLPGDCHVRQRVLVSH
jgi:hypothetical protein